LGVHVFPKVILRDVSRSVIPRNVDIATLAPVLSPGISYDDAVFVVTNNRHHVHTAKTVTRLSFVDGATRRVGFSPGPDPNDTSTVLIEQLFQTILDGVNRMKPSGGKINQLRNAMHLSFALHISWNGSRRIVFS